MHLIRHIVACLAAVAALAGSASARADSTITYQGQLQNNGVPVNGQVEMSFELFDAGTGGTSVAGPIAVPSVNVTDGLFQVELDFGAGAFDGSVRWLEITAESVTLTPRQRLTAAPMAVHALNIPDDYWRLGGNSGTTPGTEFIGTSDITPLELRVDGRRAVLITPDADDNIGPNFLGGHEANSITAGARMVTIAGGGAGTLPNLATDDYAVIGGGLGNTAAAGATVAGGGRNSAEGISTTIGGGLDNSTSAAAVWSTIGGGRANEAQGSFATIAGGGPSDTNQPSSTNNVVFDDYGSIGGGAENRVGTDDGDPGNAIYATIGGGAFNTASRGGATVGGGMSNEASSNRATVGGGQGNTASALGAVVAGGEFNTAGGLHSTVPGGRGNAAMSQYSFAGGRRAKVSVFHEGAFLWADSANLDFDSVADDEFAARSTGGVRFVTAIDASGNPTAGAALASGGTSWSSISDRQAKTAIETVAPGDVLARVVSLPIHEYSYKSQNESIRHMGPMAQDFHPLFGLGEDPLRINAINLAGIALAAIQGLHLELETEREHNDQLQEKIHRLEQRTQRIDELHRHNNELAERLAALEAAVEAVPQTVLYQD